MKLGEVWHQGKITVLAAIKARLRVATHDALQQHATSHLQAPPFYKPRSSHHLATGHAIEVGGDAFNLINTRQSLCEQTLAIAIHATILVVKQAAQGNGYKIRTACSEFQASTAQISRKQ